ncbi:MAG: nicotinate phosphoribosyltransferase [Candidatus Bathyarchaeota archaeon]|jgi:nicotinate phosphoribosyltransferase|nr:nicotinate phosphoribosyltransferase [Candidatus Termiticorpusculum sp.]
MNRFLGAYNEEDLSLFTDFYELTMCAAYFGNKNFAPATFDLFVRRLPENRSYLLFTGLEQILLYLQSIKFTERHLAYLKQQGFAKSFLDYLRDFKFTGDVWAVPEGTIVFPNEPLVRITAPIIEAQIVETFLLNTVNLQTTMSTKASRVIHAAQGRTVIEFGLRREHGVDAGMKVARSSYIAGCRGTSNVLAGMIYDIPVFGTMAHSFIMTYPREIDAFRAFTKTFPEKTTLLIDTYDDLSGLEKAVIVAKELETKGLQLSGVRLDSGDLTANSKKIRQILDANGLEYVKIFVSGDLDEFRISELISKGAPIDSFGVGTKMGTSSDRPYLDIIYKPCETLSASGAYVPVMKLSPDKFTLPGRKQVYRCKDSKGNYVQDVIALSSEKKITMTENVTEIESLLVNVMSKGELVYSFPSLNQIRTFASENSSKLSEKYQTITNAETYPVKLSPKLHKLVEFLREKIITTEVANYSHA